MDWIVDGRLRTFWAVARHLSFTDAAASLKVTQPAVSLQIRSLENTLGMRLFKRNAAGLELTEVGEVLLRHLGSLFDQAVRLENDVARVGGVVRGTVGIAVSMAIASYVLPEIVARFSERHRTCTLETVLGNSRVILGYVVDETVDVGIVSDPVDRRDVVIEPFIEDEVVLVVGPQHPWAARGTVTIRELVEAPFLMRERGSGTRKVFEAALQRAGVSPRDLDVVASFGGFEAAKATAMMGVGVTAVPRIAVRDDIGQGRLAMVRCAELPMRRNFNLVYSKRTPVPERVERFLECARDVARRVTHAEPVTPPPSGI